MRLLEAVGATGRRFLQRAVKSGGMAVAGMPNRRPARLGTALLGALLCAAPCACRPVEAAPAATCDQPGGIGTTRTITLHPRQHVGSAPYAAFGLADREIVLTFDDGPNPASTPAILKTLRENCVKATFFPIGSAAAGNPALLREVIAAGHSMGGHTRDHETLNAMPLAEAEASARDGFAPLKAAGVAPQLFRFPGLADSPALLAWADAQNLAVVGVDIDPSDWAGDPARDTLARLKTAIAARGRGIILMHDSQPNTAAFLPDLLAWLNEGGYRIVHLEAEESRPAGGTAVEVVAAP